MKQLITQAIILARTDFGEADRILTLLTPDYGKLRLMAKGVRRIKSKLAGGIELFSVSHITFIKGRGEVGTLISTRLITHYGNIVKDLPRTMLAYELIKQLNKATEDEPEPEYFHLLEQAFVALDDVAVSPELTQLWFAVQLLTLSGHQPNLRTDTAGQKLAADSNYNFDFDAMAFAPNPRGRFAANHVKLLRLGFGHHTPKILQQVNGIEKLLPDIAPLVQTMLQSHLRVGI